MGSSDLLTERQLIKILLWTALATAILCIGISTLIAATVVGDGPKGATGQYGVIGAIGQRGEEGKRGEQGATGYSGETGDHYGCSDYLYPIPTCD